MIGIMWFLWLTGSFKCFWCWSSSLCDGWLLPSKKDLSCTWLSCPGSFRPLEVSASSENKNDVLQLEDVAFKIWGTPKGFFKLLVSLSFHRDIYQPILCQNTQQNCLNADNLIIIFDLYQTPYEYCASTEMIYNYRMHT